MSLRVGSSDSVSNLLQEDIDLATRFGRPLDSTLVTRRLAPNRRAGKLSLAGIPIVAGERAAIHGRPRASPPPSILAADLASR